MTVNFHKESLVLLWSEREPFMLFDKLESLVRMLVDRFRDVQAMPYFLRLRRYVRRVSFLLEIHFPGLRWLWAPIAAVSISYISGSGTRGVKYSIWTLLGMKGSKDPDPFGCAVSRAWLSALSVVRIVGHGYPLQSFIGGGQL